jgi:hypothetical protein
MGLVVVGPVLEKSGEIRSDLWKELEKGYGSKVRPAHRGNEKKLQPSRFQLQKKSKFEPMVL